MLTEAQKTALAADIAANDAEFGALPHNSDGAWEIKEAYNLPADPELLVWKTSVSVDEAMEVMVWTEFLALTEPQRNTLLDGLLSNHDFNPSLPNIRQGIAACLPEDEADGCRDALLAICKEPATRAEALLASGATRTFVGNLTYQDVMSAMGW